jgi:hypothetical protein
MLLLHGVRRTLRIPVDVRLQGMTLEARGRTTLKHDDYGLRRVSAGAGTVKVANELPIELTLVARAR